MQPINFDQANRVFTKPASMSDDECNPLSVFSDGTHLISCWRPSLKERLAVLFRRKVWLWIFGQSQPPVALGTKSPFSKEDR